MPEPNDEWILIAGKIIAMCQLWEAKFPLKFSAITVAVSHCRKKKT